MLPERTVSTLYQPVRGSTPIPRKRSKAAPRSTRTASSEQRNATLRLILGLSAGHGSSDYLFVPVRCVPVNAYVIVEDWF